MQESHAASVVGVVVAPASDRTVKVMVAKWRQGAPDLTIFVPTREHHCLRIEMKKRRENFPSPSAARRAVRAGQDETIALMRSLGYYSTVAYGWEEAARVVCEYLIPSDAR